MAKQVALPDGSVGEFPDDMSDDDIAGVLRKQYPPPVDPQAYVAGMPAPRTPEQQNALTFGAGAQHAMDRAALGVKGLLPESVQQGGDQAEAWLRAKLGMAPAPNLPQQVREGQAYLADKGWRGTAGEVAGDLAMSAAPMGAAGQALGVAGRFLPSTLARFAPAVGDVAANAGYAAATNPDDRSMAAAFGGAGAAVGGALTRTLGGVVRPSQEAQAMMSAGGVRLTPGQAGEGIGGALARTYEGALEAVPLLGKPVTAAKQQALTDWNKFMARSQGIEASGDVGLPAVQATQKALSGEYGHMFPEGMMLKFTDDAVTDYARRVVELSNKVAPRARDAFKDLAEWIGRQVTEGVDASQWKEIVEHELDGAMKAARRDGQYSLFTALKGLDDHLNGALESMGGPAVEAKNAADAAWRNSQVMKNVTSRVSVINRGGVAYPSEVASVAAKKGNGPILKQALAAQEVFGNNPGLTERLGNIIKAGAVGATGHAIAGPGVTIPAAAVSLLGATEVGRRFLLGQIPWQAVVRAQPQLAAQVGRVLGVQGVPQPVEQEQP